jgi:LemA protein
MNWALIVIPISILAILLLAVGYYFNRLVVLGNRYQNAFSQIDVQLKRRYDLIPNLVECVKGYLSHEKGTLEAVASARNQAMAASRAAATKPGDAVAMEQLSQAEGALSGAVGRLIAVAESYPELKASQNMLGLQEELTTTENRVGFARQAFNDSVTAYNSQRQTFPCVLVASLCGFRDASLLQAATERERAAPEIKLD